MPQTSKERIVITESPGRTGSTPLTQQKRLSVSWLTLKRYVGSSTVLGQPRKSKADT